MQNTALEINSNPDRMPYVRFERRAIEDKTGSLAAGHYVAKDIDYALITPPYSKDVFETKVTSWFAQLEADKNGGRIHPDWVERYHRMYEAWQKGQELPLDGFPIKGWGVISPAQQETLIKMHILTVESLAAITEEGIRRVGMGGTELKKKAETWLKQLKKAGPATVEIAALSRENDQLKGEVAGMRDQIEELMRLVKAQQNYQDTGADMAFGTACQESITANDLMDD